jgi:hypothetical protein
MLTFIHQIKQLFVRGNRRHSRKAPSRPRARCIPRLEMLEDRIQPSTWTGGSSDGSDYWSDGQNWLGGTAPMPGDNLVFPADSDAHGFTTFNDLAYTFGSVSFQLSNQSTSYQILGSALQLTGDIDIGRESIEFHTDIIFTSSGESIRPNGPFADIFIAPPNSITVQSGASLNISVSVDGILVGSRLVDRGIISVERGGGYLSTTLRSSLARVWM